MTNTAKDETSTDAQPLSWTRKKEWGSEGATHRAEADGWRYCVDSPKKGSWVLRGWGPDDEFLYRDGRTMKDMKAQASDHLDAYRTKMAQAAAALAALPAIAQAAADGMAGVGAAITTLFSRVQGISRRIPQPCGCPTPTHRMSCGVGGRVIVRPKPVVLLLDEGAALLGSLDLDACGRCKGSGIDPEDSYPAEGPSEFSMGEPAVIEPCRDCSYGSDDQCVDASGGTYPEHDYDEVTCRRCDAEPND